MFLELSEDVHSPSRYLLIQSKQWKQENNVLNLLKVIFVKAFDFEQVND